MNFLSILDCFQAIKKCKKSFEPQRFFFGGGGRPGPGGTDLSGPTTKVK